LNELPPSAFGHAIQALHGTRSRLIDRERVVEQFEGAPVWEGDVLVFELIDHPTARRCFAWEIDGKVTAVLALPPIESARDAVRAPLVAEYRARREN